MFENPTVAAKRHEILADQLAEHRRQQARGLALLQLAMLLTFLLYLLFGLHLYLGDATSWAGYFTTWVTVHAIYSGSGQALRLLG
ncbi:MAG TPA: hypothetical protein PLB10_19240, partial [Thiolinea sp.]|nr:hypothetical protein [Thiolinea sp.]